MALKKGFQHYICHHMTTHQYLAHPAERGAELPTKLTLITQDSCFLGDPVYVELLHNEPGSCEICLTDYITTVKLRTPDTRAEDEEILHVTIVSYHQIGDGHSPLDWKWQTFSTPPSCLRPHDIRRIHQRDSCVWPGIVRRRWAMDELGPSISLSPDNQKWTD